MPGWPAVDCMVGRDLRKRGPDTAPYRSLASIDRVDARSRMADGEHGQRRLCLLDAHYLDAHYDERCFLPIRVYEGTSGKPLAVIPRPGKTADGAGRQIATSRRGSAHLSRSMTSTIAAKNLTRAASVAPNDAPKVSPLPQVSVRRANGPKQALWAMSSTDTTSI